jgi:hypothetical protein
MRISNRLRRASGSLATGKLGATDQFLPRERSVSAQTIVDENADKDFGSRIPGEW